LYYYYIKMVKLVVQFDNVVEGLEANKAYFAVTGEGSNIIVYKDDMTFVTVDASKLTTTDTSDTTSTDAKSYKILWQETTSGGKAKSKRNRRNQKKQKKSRRN